PLAVGSPYFRTLPLQEHGLEWIHPGVPLAHPLDDGTAAVLHRSLDETVRGFGADGRSWRRLVGALVPRWDDLLGETTAPRLRIPRRPFPPARFGLPGMLPATTIARLLSTAAGRGLSACLAAPPFLPLAPPFPTPSALLL